jgi:hypothetical protein
LLFFFPKNILCFVGFLVLVTSVLSDCSLISESDEDVAVVSIASGSASFSGLGALLCVSVFSSIFFWVSSTKRIAILGKLFFF